MRVYKSETGKKAVYESYDKIVARWGIPTEESDLKTSYGTTHVIIAGDESNPPLLAFHGVGDNSAIMWMVNAWELAKHFRIIAIDTMGGAGKSQPNENYDRRFDLAKWYGDVLRELNIKKAYAIGVSYGAYHCQLLMISYPDIIEKIVGIAGYVSATGYSGSKYSAMLRIMKFFLPAILFPTKKNSLKAAANLIGPGAKDLLADNEIADHFLLLMKHYRSQAQFNHNRRTFSREELESIREKSLFLIGDLDIMVNFPGAKRAMVDFKINNKIITGAGHAVNCTKPREIEAEIINFCLGK